MTTTAVADVQPKVLSDLIASTKVRSAALVVGGSLLVALASQIRIPLGFTPVPINGLTFAALIVGAGLGAKRGAASLGLFWVLGVIGLPFFQAGNSGWTYATGATGGYLVGSFLAATVVGAVAERGGDRRVATSVATMVIVNAVLIWGLGTLWLSHVLGVPVFGGAKSGFALGVQPFIAGDLFKVVLAGLLLPGAWKLVQRWS
ncbi:MAG: biotin transporter BioY [Microthrixaceae bacterium]|nr:biotin transporter BioY [Microthrixaceae bacterium]